jgi:predicted nucleic acid-binding protein
MWFIDTNPFFYFYDDRFPAQQASCRHWLAELSVRRRGLTNLQVANEFANVVFKRLPQLSPAEVFAMSDDILVWGASPISVETVATARDTCLRYHYSWWDCLLLASALELGCTHFLSEDLQDGQRIDMGGRALTIVDPFAHSPEQFRASR